MEIEDADVLGCGHWSDEHSSLHLDCAKPLQYGVQIENVSGCIRMQLQLIWTQLQWMELHLDAFADSVAFRWSCIRIHLHLQLHSDGVAVAVAVAVALLVSSAFSKFRRRFAAAVFLLLGRREKRPFSGAS